jgi:hypothetical protein
MRSRGPYILLAVAVLSACVWLVYRANPSSSAGDVSIVFLGLTNDPGSSVVTKRLFVAGNGSGLHALFAVTNISAGRYVRFGIAAVETQGREGWRAVGPASDQPALGNGFARGYGWHYAIPWPAGLGTDQRWRLRLWVLREPRLLSLKLRHQGFGLRPYGRHTVTSPVVTSPTPVAAESGANDEDAQPGIPANRGQASRRQAGRRMPRTRPGPLGFRASGLPGGLRWQWGQPHTGVIPREAFRAARSNPATINIGASGL